MTPEETRQAADVMLAHAEGKQIEWRAESNDQWKSCRCPLWEWGTIEYRVAPERWAGKIWVHPDGRIGALHEHVDPQCWTKNGWRLIEAKEVEP